MKYLLSKLLVFIHRPIILSLGTIFGPVFIKGWKNVPRRGKLIVVVNHISDVDAVLVQLASKRLIHFMAADYLFKIPVVKNIMRAFAAFPVDRDRPDKRSIKHALKILNEEQALGIFPEGRLSTDGKLKKLLPGVAMLIKMTDSPVICCGINGAHKIIPYGKVIPRPALSKITLTWGEVIRFDKDDSKEDILEKLKQELITLSNDNN